MVLELKKKLLILSTIIFILDQVLKYVVISFIGYQDTIHIIPNFLYLTYVKNTGGAWSIFDSNPIFLIMIGLICILGLGYYIYKKNNYCFLEVIYLVLIIGGVFGNFIDRIIRDGVVDYIGVILGSYYFPVFNLADICIVCGAILLMIDSFRSDKDAIRSK